MFLNSAVKKAVSKKLTFSKQTQQYMTSSYMPLLQHIRLLVCVKDGSKIPVLQLIQPSYASENIISQ